MDSGFIYTPRIRVCTRWRDCGRGKESMGSEESGRENKCRWCAFVGEQEVTCLSVVFLFSIQKRVDIATTRHFCFNLLAILNVPLSLLIVHFRQWFFLVDLPSWRDLIFITRIFAYNKRKWLQKENNNFPAKCAMKWCHQWPRSSCMLDNVGEPIRHFSPYKKRTKEEEKQNVINLVFCVERSPLVPIAFLTMGD